MLGTCISLPLSAQVIPGRWEKVHLLPAGNEVRVYSDSGEILDCFLFSSKGEVLVVVDSLSHEQHRIPKSSVQKIIAKDYDDTIKNGALIGLAAGAAGGVLFASLLDSPKHPYSAGDRVLGGLLFGLVGMGIGALIDFKHQGQEVIYEAIKKQPNQD